MVGGYNFFQLSIILARAALYLSAAAPVKAECDCHRLSRPRGMHGGDALNNHLPLFPLFPLFPLNASIIWGPWTYTMYPMSAAARMHTIIICGCFI